MLIYDCLALVDRFFVFCCIGIKVLLCDFHREQAWHRFLTKRDNACSDPDTKEEILALIRRVARSASLQEMDTAMKDLYCSEHWRDNGKFRDYFKDHWLPIKEVQIVAILNMNYRIIFL